MRITFSRDLVVANNAAVSDILAAYEPSWGDLTPAGCTGKLRCFHGAAHALQFDAETDHYTYVVDDSTFVRVLHAYVKVARIVAPLIHSAVSVLKRLKGEVLPEYEAINAEFAHIQYVDEMYEAGAGDEGLDIRTTAQGDPVLAN